MTTVTENDLKRLEDLVNNLSQTMIQRFDKVDQDIVDLKIGQAELKGEISTIKERIDNVQQNVSKLETSQNAQIWTLIVTIVGAVITALIKFWYSSNP